ncbi:MAG: T9SS type A sorting domain-containing protein [Bacteroidota bacterium]|nr:T9SS type A sorting domain-containing protein [Bacteroidota bacterium]
MKNTFTKIFFSLVLLSPQYNRLQAQSIQASPFTVVNNIPPRIITFVSNPGLGKTKSCNTDSLNYVFNKATAFSSLTINNTTSGNTFAQWYPAPQSLTVSGFDFYAWQSTLTSAVVTLTCRMYNSTSDSLPLGTPLATVTVNIDSTFGGGLLSVLKKRAIFSNPVTTSAPFVLTIESSSSVNVGVVANNWIAVAPAPANGRSEWLSSVKIGSNWVRSYNVMVGANRFNADFIFQPWVSYSITAGFTPSSVCTQTGVPINFTNTSSPVLFSRFFGIWAYNNLAQYNFQWDYGDTMGISYAINGTRIYNYNANYTVKLYDSLYGWSSGCADSYTTILGELPPPTIATNNGPLCQGATLRLYADSVPDVTYYWTGPNGFTSNQRNPVITNAGISMIGNYSVRTIRGQCSSAVALTYVNVVNSFSASNNGPLCSGQNLNLFATLINGATYSWTGPNSFSSNLQSPVRSSVIKADSGLYNVSITLAGCGTLGPFSTNAVVNEIPLTPVAGNNGPLCVGDNLTLSASSLTGGTYNWNGPNNYSSTQQNPVRPVVANTFAGTYTVTVSLNGCTSLAGSTNVIINNIPATPTAGNNGPVCAAQNLSLTCSTVSGATYSWSGPNNFTSALQNPTRTSLTISDAGIYSVVAIINGCASLTATTNAVITLNTPAPSASGNGPLCPGQSFQLSATGVSGATYSWTGPKNFSSSQQNPVINNIDSSYAGVYSVTASTTVCGTSSAANVNLLVNNLPAAPTAGNNGPLCQGQTLNLTSSSITGATYYWSGPGGFTSSTQNPVITNINSSKAGLYSVYVSVSGCGVSATSTTLAISHAIPNTPTALSNAPLCVGDSLKLSAVANGTGPNVTYSWMGPNNFNATLQNPVVNSVTLSNSGIYSLTINDSGCTSASGTVNVIIKTKPAAPVASSNAPFCAGGNLLLSATTIVGATYVWTGIASFTSSVQYPSINGANASHSGTYTVKSIVDGCYSNPSSTNVLIYDLPETPAATNDGPKCAGESISLFASTVPGATYSWNGPQSFSSTLKNPILAGTTVSMSGKYNVIAIVDGCTSPEGSTDVSINSYPAAPVLSSFPQGFACIGDSLQLFANFVNGASYEWTGPAGFGSTKQNPVIKNISLVNAGVYEATLTKNGCMSPAKTIDIAVVPVPQTSAINGIANVKSAEIQTYSVSGSSGSIFNWIVLGGTQTSGTNTSSITVLWGAKGVGSVGVTETNPGGCKGIKQNLSIVIGPAAGMEDDLMGSGQIKLYPNPAEKSVQLEFNYDQLRELNFTITDMLGKNVFESIKQVKVQKEILTIDIAKLKAGLYFVNIMVDGQTGVFKLMVK